MFEKKNKYSNKHISLWSMYYGAICSSSSVYRQYKIYMFNSKLSFVCVTHTHTQEEREKERNDTNRPVSQEQRV